MPPHRTWLMMPFMHSESLEDQQVRFALNIRSGRYCNGGMILSLHGELKRDANQCGTE